VDAPVPHRGLTRRARRATYSQNLGDGHGDERDPLRLRAASDLRLLKVFELDGEPELTDQCE
jgi:hypothetical protein